VGSASCPCSPWAWGASTGMGRAGRGPTRLAWRPSPGPPRPSLAGGPGPVEPPPGRGPIRGRDRHGEPARAARDASPTPIPKSFENWGLRAVLGSFGAAASVRSGGWAWVRSAPEPGFVRADGLGFVRRPRLGSFGRQSLGSFGRRGGGGRVRRARRGRATEGRRDPDPANVAGRSGRFLRIAKDGPGGRGAHADRGADTGMIGAEAGAYQRSPGISPEGRERAGSKGPSAPGSAGPRAVRGRRPTAGT
jgi:hypothetical protein